MNDLTGAKVPGVNELILTRALVALTNVNVCKPLPESTWSTTIEPGGIVPRSKVTEKESKPPGNIFGSSEIISGEQVGGGGGVGVGVAVAVGVGVGVGVVVGVGVGSGVGVAVGVGVGVGVGVCINANLSTVPAETLQTYNSPLSSSPKEATLKFIESINKVC